MICKICNRRYGGPWGSHRNRIRMLKKEWEKGINDEKAFASRFNCYDCGLKAHILVECPSRNQLIESLSSLRKGKLLCQSCKKEVKKMDKYGPCQECDLSILEQFL